MVKISIMLMVTFAFLWGLFTGYVIGRCERDAE